MIPINNAEGPTPLSIEKTAKLLQALVDLKNSSESEPLPRKIENAVNNLMSAQTTFVEEIDTFLHTRESYDDGKNVNTVTAMIETCPELLATKDGLQIPRLPIHVAAMNNTSKGLETFVPLLARVGVQYEVGGKEARGGLLIQTGENDEFANALQCLAGMKGAIGTFEALRNAKPEPLFSKNDIIKHDLFLNS